MNIVIIIIVTVQAYRRVASREERELQDVERAMEEELVAEHMQVERVIHLRFEQVQDKQQLKYLVKVCNSLLNPQRVTDAQSWWHIPCHCCS